MDKVIIDVSKPHTRHIFKMEVLESVDEDQEARIMDCWKTFNVADATIFIKGAINDLKP